MSVKVNFLFIVSATKHLVHIPGKCITALAASHRYPQPVSQANPLEVRLFFLFSKEFQWNQF